MNIKWIVCGLLAAMMASSLIGCKNAADEPAKTDETQDTAAVDEDAIVMSVTRTKTPQKKFNIADYEYLSPNQGGNRDERPNDPPEQPDSQEKGNGLELDGYVQLLNSIDRPNFTGPDGWDRHPIDDLFDGIFETTDQGTNKYGHGESQFTVSWQLKESLVLDAYTVVTGSDAASYPERNPEKWTITASEDGENWVTLHSVEAAGLPVANYTPVTYTFENDTPYRYYRWNIEATAGNSGFQAAELLLYTAEDNSVLPEVSLGSLPFPEYGAAAENAKEGNPITSNDAWTYISEHDSLTSLINTDNLFVDADLFSDGPIENLFDSIYMPEDFEQNDGGKMGAWAQQLHIAWKTTEETTVSAYAMITGNDTEWYSERNPYAWTLYGSKDGQDWQIIDAVIDSKLPAANFAPCVYEVESPEAYSYYCLVIEGTKGTFQLCELILMK